MGSPRRTALVTGASGQDGVYLARLLADEGTRVVGTVAPGRGSTARVAAYLGGVEVVERDITDLAGMRDLLVQVRPDEVYNLAALSSVAQSWQEPDRTRQVNRGAVQGLLEAAVEVCRSGQEVRFFQASSAEVAGAASESPYAQAKAEAEHLVATARERHGLHASAARLASHESPLRTPRFVTRKITLAAAEIALGRREVLTLGNLDVRRDWGFAGDYVRAFVRMVRADEPGDLPIGSGTSHTLGDLVETAFRAAGVDDPWSRIEQDPALLRPADSAVLVTDPEPAAARLGWRATTGFEDLVARMVEVDLVRLRSGVEDDLGYL
ncbi:GDP-mannose 4,6-dehydratase [Nocardioides sp. SYSU DS0651]|uniref:GDP-mannose 4,6-dehydratase n=1 Tax=Nocardioides sp. SYSU DS0651 TaxID=3415955 RepID=UPI003F4C88E1